MAQKRSNPALREQAGLGNVIAVAASDDRAFTPSLLDNQARFVAVRYGLPAFQARIVAGLAFFEVRP